jgi:AcrR family transcriptional regulator
LYKRLVTEGLRERKKARMHQGILETAVEIFRERGYEKTTVEEIVRRVEISQPTFYRYFASKDAVLREVAGGMLREWAREAEAVSRQEGEDTGAALRRIFERVAATMLEDRPLWQCIVLADALNPMRAPEQRDADRDATLGIAAILARGQRRGEITERFSAVRLAENLVAMQLLACLAWGVDMLENGSIEAVLGENLDFFLRGAAAAKS